MRQKIAVRMLDGWRKFTINSQVPPGTIRCAAAGLGLSSNNIRQIDWRMHGRYLAGDTVILA
jgi:hypothetical protein